MTAITTTAAIIPPTIHKFTFLAGGASVVIGVLADALVGMVVVGCCVTTADVGVVVVVGLVVTAVVVVVVAVVAAVVITAGVVVVAGFAGIFITLKAVKWVTWAVIV